MTYQFIKDETTPVRVSNGDDGDAVLGGQPEARTGGATPPTGSISWGTVGPFQRGHLARLEPKETLAAPPSEADILADMGGEQYAVPRRKRARLNGAVRATYMTNKELIAGLRHSAFWAGVDAYKFALNQAADRLELYSEATRLANIAMLGADHDSLSLDPYVTPDRPEHLADCIEGLKDAARGHSGKYQFIKDETKGEGE